MIYTDFLCQVYRCVAHPPASHNITPTGAVSDIAPGGHLHETTFRTFLNRRQPSDENTPPLSDLSTPKICTKTSLGNIA
ncbi:uncharacterized protein QC761_0011910 [Podospora bellae-mahoneyi]|uniref:Uncharacterized protein n=1 Tax=Podospora bellae-mahoneyi TaxID=2093777 RepID=A0ABR0FX40_9PEZI|nr:hypothetical protein QC761_0011910 [Podospora bellae-mahoneyi]